MARSTWWNPDLVETAKQLSPGRRWWLWLVIVYGPMFAWLCAPLTGLGGWSTRGVEFFVFVPMLGLGLWLVALPLAFAKGRDRARGLFRNGAVLFLGFLPFLWLGERARMLAFELAGERAAPLVAAIERYFASNGAPPACLEDLVPRWLGQMPTRLPPLRLLTGDGLFGNAWILEASVPSGVINFDAFYYFPNQNYPADGWGGSWQRLGRWAYLHE